MKASDLEFVGDESNGHCRVFPCNVGDTVYCINAGKIKEDEVKAFGIGHGDAMWFMLEGTEDAHWTIERFGKTVFLTEDEAEASLIKG